MPVNTRHPQYIEHAGTWKRLRRLVQGEVAVKASTTEELPKIGEQDAADYDTYLAGAELANFTGRTEFAMLGRLFGKTPDVQLPDSVRDQYLTNIDLAGTPLMVFAHQIARQVVEVGRTGILVDQTRDRTQQRAYFVCYMTEQMINWEERTLLNQVTLSRQTLEETVVSRDPVDEFQHLYSNRWRDLVLEDGVYHMRVHTRDASGAIVFTDIVPDRRRQPFPVGSIPFVPITPYTLRPNIEHMPLLDLGVINLHHYRKTAEMSHALRVTAMPQPIIFGDTNKDERRRIGTPWAWELDAGASAVYLEPNGRGIPSIDQAIQRNENQAVMLGARMIEGSKREAETAEALRLRQGGETAVLAAIARTVSRGITRALKLAVEWDGANPEEASFELSTDFTDRTMSADDATKWFTVWEGGGMTDEDLFHKYQEGGVIREGLTFDEWQQALADRTRQQLVNTVNDIPGLAAA